MSKNDEAYLEGLAIVGDEMLSLIKLGINADVVFKFISNVYSARDGELFIAKEKLLEASYSKEIVELFSSLEVFKEDNDDFEFEVGPDTYKKLSNLENLGLTINDIAYAYYNLTEEDLKLLISLATNPNIIPLFDNKQSTKHLN